MKQKTVPLTYQLPARNWIQLPNGKWSSVEWTTAARAEAEAARYKLVAA